jgi:sugar lactone lactonase YvrE
LFTKFQLASSAWCQVAVWEWRVNSVCFEGKDTNEVDTDDKEISNQCTDVAHGDRLISLSAWLELIQQYV